MPPSQLVRANVDTMDIQARLARITKRKPVNVQISRLGSEREERGLFADKSFTPGQVLYREMPLYSGIDGGVDAAYPFCGWCLRDLKLDPNDVSCFPPTITGPGLCFCLYCTGSDCGERAFDVGHDLYCSARLVTREVKDAAERVERFVSADQLSDDARLELADSKIDGDGSMDTTADINRLPLRIVRAVLGHAVWRHAQLKGVRRDAPLCRDTAATDPDIPTLDDDEPVMVASLLGDVRVFRGPPWSLTSQDHESHRRQLCVELSTMLRDCFTIAYAGDSNGSRYLCNVIQALVTPDTIDSLAGVISRNVFGLHVSTDDGDMGHAWGLYVVSGMMNHSCEPNVEYQCSQDDDTIEITAVRNIEAGDELLISYLGPVNTPHSTTAARQGQLWEQYGFDCQCVLCSEAPS